MSTITNSLFHIMQAKKSIRFLARHTSLNYSASLSLRSGLTSYLKLEIQQPTRSFKIRGAANKILSLSPEQRNRGVITISTGNHGHAVAYTARELGITATVCISNRVPGNKVANLKQLGASVVIHGQSQDEAEVRAKELAQEYGYILIHPFDDPHIIAGQGTIGLEIVYELPDVTTILVPLSGGGLISGIALAVKAINPQIQVIGVSMERSCVMYHSLQAGKPLEISEEDTLADSLLGGIGLANQHTFSTVQRYVDDVILVSEEEIAHAMAFALHQEHLVVEGAGAVGIAALLNKRVKATGPVISIISGGNVDMSTLLNIAQNYRS